MATYILIDCDIGFETQVIEEIKKNESVKEVQGVFGMFNILLKIEHPEVKNLNMVIIKKIQEIKHVQSIQSLIISEQI